ncbi:hypothetical protein, partial [Aeromonas caviae]
LQMTNMISYQGLVRTFPSVFPADGINISDKQIKDVWKFFNLPGHHLPDNSLRLVLSEVKDHRNAIAHGREKAINIGSK